MVARVQFQRDGAAVVNFKFSDTVVEQLKVIVPSSHRSYDPATKAWRIRPPYPGDVVRLLERHFPSRVDIEEPPAHPGWAPTPINPVDRALHVLHLRDSAPDTLVEVAYRHLAKSAHPDHGGSDAAMERLNAAVALLRQRRVAAS